MAKKKNYEVEAKRKIITINESTMKKLRDKKEKLNEKIKGAKEEIKVLDETISKYVAENIERRSEIQKLEKADEEDSSDQPKADGEEKPKPANVAAEEKPVPKKSKETVKQG